MKTQRLLGLGLAGIAALSCSHGVSALIGGEADLRGKHPAVVCFLGGDTAGRRGVRCSAAKIGGEAFLTAAHCVVNYTTGALDQDFGSGRTLRLAAADTPKSPSEFRPVTVNRVSIHPDYLKGLESYVEYKKDTINGLAKAYSGKVLRGLIESLEKHQNLGSRFPDVAVISIVEKTPEIPVIEVDFSTLSAEDDVELAGYGCESGLDSQLTPKAYPFGRRKWGETQVIRVDEVNFYTYSERLRHGTPSLCPGDSGGPVIRGGKVVGVNGAIYGVKGEAQANSNMAAKLDTLESWLVALAK